MDKKLILASSVIGIALLFFSKKKTASIKIIDIVNNLKKSNTQTYDTRDLSQINKIVVHHSATTSGTPESYARYHVDTRNFPGIGYHYVVQQDGTIYQTNYLNTISWHTGGENTSSIGICLTGNFDVQQPFPAQMAALNSLIAYIKSQLNRPLQIKGHRDYSTKSCPGDHIVLPQIAGIYAIKKTGKGLTICRDKSKSTSQGKGACSFHRGVEKYPKKNIVVRDSDIEYFFFKDYFIADFLKSHKINVQSWNRYGDPNLTMEKLNFLSNKGNNIDDIAQQLSFKLGIEIDPEDIINVVMDYKSPSDYYEHLKQSTKQILSTSV